MTKVVINSCYGGFGLSDKAVKFYAKAKGIELYTSDEDSHFGPHYYLCPASEYETLNLEKQNEMYFVPRSIDRTDADLINIVETLGEEANGWAADLKVVEIPDDVEWQLEEYDGAEWVAEKHRTWS